MEEGQWGNMRKWSLYDFRLCWGWDAEVKKKKKKKKSRLKMAPRASQAVQWVRICLAMQGTPVPFLVQEDPICCGAPKPVYHNY